MIFTVKGSIESINKDFFSCIDFSNFVLKAYQVGIGTETEIATVTISANGTFNQSVTSATNAIKLKLFLENGEIDELIAESKRFCADDEIDFIFSIDLAKSGDPLYNKIYDGVNALCTGGATPVTLLPTLSEEELADLACLTCFNSRGIARLNNAIKLWLEFVEFEDGLPMDYAYPAAATLCGEFVGNPSVGLAVFFVLERKADTLHQALTHSRAQFNTLLQAAIDANEIDDILDPTLLNRLEACRDAVLFNTNDDGAYYDAKLIHLSSNTYEIKSNLLDAALDTSLDKVIDDGIAASDPNVEDLVPLRVLSGHLRNFAPFLKIAIDEIPGFEPNYYNLTKNGPDYWFDMMDGLAGSFPAEYESSTSPEIDYANDIYDSISTGYPTAKLVYALVDSTYPEKAAISSVLEDNPDFNIKEDAVHLSFAPGGAITEAMIDNLQALQRTLRLTGELDDIKLTGGGASESIPASTALRSTKSGSENGLTSAAGIAMAGAGNLLSTLTGLGISEEMAVRIHCNAKAINQANMAALVDAFKYEYNPKSSQDGVAYASPDLPTCLQIGSPTFSMPAGLEPEDLPDLATIFGSFDTCECEDCQSVYSPAAYLTDLLNWLSKDIVGPSTTSFKKGIVGLKDRVVSSTTKNRRRDILSLYLNCKNTNTTLPYIDLVNEILSLNIMAAPYDRGNYNASSNLFPSTGGSGTSGAVAKGDIWTISVAGTLGGTAITVGDTIRALVDAPGQTAANWARSANSYLELQTTKTAEELLAEPEERSWFSSQHATLHASAYPWVLPYNYAFDQVVSLMKALGRPYPTLIHDLSKATDQKNTSFWARTYLEINEQLETLLINTSSTSAYITYWSFTPSGSAPYKIGPFLKAADLKFEYLKETVGTYFVYHSGATKVTLNLPAGEDADICDIDNYTFSLMDEGIAHKLQKFIRLQQRTGLSSWQLDMALAVLDSGNLSSTFLIRLASCIEFSQTFAVPFSELLVWISPLPHEDLFNASVVSTYFTEKYLNPLLPSQVRTFFGTTGTNYTSVTITGLTNPQKDILCRVLNITALCLTNLLSYLTANSIVSGGDTIKSALPKLERYSSLINTFEIPEEEITNYLDILGNPLSSGDIIKNCWNFVEILGQFRTLGIGLTELKDLVRGNFDQAALESEAEILWTKTEKAYQDAYKANPDLVFSGSPPAPSGSDLTLLTDIIIANLSVEFKLSPASLYSIVNAYSGTWLTKFVSGPELTRQWNSTNTAFSATLKDAFTPVFKLLKRLVAIKSLCKLDQVGIDSAIAIEISGSPVISGASPTPFYWVKNTYPSFTTAKLNELLWVKNAADLASFFDLSQGHLYADFDNVFGFISDYYTNNNSTYISGNTANISTLYNNLGSKSPLLSLTINEFIELFLRAKSLAVTVTDLVSVMQSLSRILNSTTKFGIKPLEGWEWVWSAWSSGFTPATMSSALAADVRRVIKGRYTNFATYSDLIVPVQNGLRARLRDALVAKYRAVEGKEDSNAVYKTFLLDPEMSPCMLTSRLVAAISSTQLLVHRALLKLESDVLINEKNKKEWQWRKNYRVWEANRKVFLYPENWIDPSIRRGKTTLFKDSEEILLQGEITDANCEKAYADYLRGLAEVANLDVRATYIEDPTVNLASGGAKTPRNNPDETLHVFARSWNPPFKHYHRTMRYGVWTGWEPIDVEIDSEHLVPAMFNRKLYLFFTQFMERSVSSPSGEDYYVNPNILPLNNRIKYYEIALGYTRLEFGKWTGKKILSEKMLAGRNSFENDGYNRKLTLDRMSAGHWYWGNNLYTNSIYAHYPGPGSVPASRFAVNGMKKEDFYFWAENQSNGNLQIHCRRTFETYARYSNLNFNTYTEFAYGYIFSINAGDEMMSVISPVNQLSIDGINSGNFSTKKRFLARPYMTVPFHQQIKWGKAMFRPGDDELEQIPIPLGTNDNGLFVKLVANELPGNQLTLFQNSREYTLTYPQQFKHSTLGQPFFYSDGKRLYFFQYAPFYTQRNTQTA